MTPKQAMREQFRKLLKLDDSPHKIAISFAVGVFITFSPFYGLHTLLGILLFTLFRLNKVAVLVGCSLNLPWISPAIYFPCYLLGSQLLEIVPFAHSFAPFSWENFKIFFSSWESFKLLVEPINFFRIFVPTLIGSVIFGSMAALIGYFWIEQWVRKRRARKIVKVLEQRRTEEKTPVCS